MEKCFVIQPFDGAKYDTRYEETYEPAIKNCGLEAYRVDRDPKANILIFDIEKNIRNSQIVLAEITEDNPNVWYELGYAYACGKDVVMICNSTRGKFPFDIQHKHILRYNTESKGDFDNLQKQIEIKIKALLDNQKQFIDIKPTLKEDEKGLSAHEKHVIIMIMTVQFTDEDIITQSELINKMAQSGFNDIATNIALRKLQSGGYVETKKEIEYGSFEEYEYNTFKLTKKGIQWVIDNEENIVLTNTNIKKLDNVADDDDDVPF